MDIGSEVSMTFTPQNQLCKKMAYTFIFVSKIKSHSKMVARLTSVNWALPYPQGHLTVPSSYTDWNSGGWECFFGLWFPLVLAVAFLSVSVLSLTVVLFFFLIWKNCTSGLAIYHKKNFDSSKKKK